VGKWREKRKLRRLSDLDLSVKCYKARTIGATSTVAHHRALHLLQKTNEMEGAASAAPGPKPVASQVRPRSTPRDARDVRLRQ